MDDSGNEAERRRRARSDVARKRGARRWLNRGSRPPPAFDRRELEDLDRELARCRHASSGNWSTGSSSAGASSSRLIPVKSEPEGSSCLMPCPMRRRAEALSGPGTTSPRGRRSSSSASSSSGRRGSRRMEERIRRELEYERLFLQTGALQTHASKEASLRVMKAEHAKLYIDLASSDSSDD